MTAQNVAARRVASATNDGSHVDTVFLSDPAAAVRVTNDTLTGELWFTVDTPGGACPPPTFGGSGVGGEFCAASVGPGAQVTVRGQFQFGTVVQLVANAATTYTVELMGRQAPA